MLLLTDEVDRGIPSDPVNPLRLNNKEKLSLKLLCGADLLESFATPGLWKDIEVSYISVLPIKNFKRLFLHK